MKALLASFVVLLSLTVAASQVRSQDKGNNPLVGRYRITTGQEGSKKLAPAEFKQDVVHFEHDVVTVYDKSKKKLYTAKYTVDTSKTPWVIHMTSNVAPIEGVKSEGLVELKGETLRLIYALPGGQAPKSFEPQEKQMLFSMTKQTGE